MRKLNAIQVQDFLLVLASQNSLFTLEAEHEPTGRVFTINTDGDSIGQVTNGLFDNADKMIQGLKQAVENNSENIRLDINLEGKLTFPVKFTCGGVKKEFGFILNLTEKEMEPIQIFSRKLDSFKRDMEEWKDSQETKMEASQAKNDEGFKRLENLMIQVAQRLDKLENLCENLRASIPLKPDISFNKASEKASWFSITDTGKTAILIAETPTRLEILPEIPSSGKYSYSFRTNHYTTTIGFGIQSKDTNAHYLFWVWTGYIEGGILKQAKGKGQLGSKDSILKMIVDMDQGTLTFFADHVAINFCSISKLDRYFVIVHFGRTGSNKDSVTLL